MVRPANYDSEKCRVINNWEKKVLYPMRNASTINRGYLIASMTICELCVKDIVEQTLGLFIPPDRNGERNAYLDLTHEHDIIYLNNKLKEITDGDYYFPPLPDEIDSRNMEKVLYEDITLNMDKEEIKNIVEAYIRRHNELLEDYDERYYQLKLSLDR